MREGDVGKKRLVDVLVDRPLQHSLHVPSVQLVNRIKMDTRTVIR